MSTAEESGFKVEYCLVLDKLKILAEIALMIGERTEYLNAIKDMNQALPLKPRQWGCPLRTYRGMKATLYRYYGPVLMAYYAVHDEKPLVFVSDVIPTLGTLLSDIYQRQQNGPKKDPPP